MVKPGVWQYFPGSQELQPPYKEINIHLTGESSGQKCGFSMAFPDIYLLNFKSKIQSTVNESALQKQYILAAVRSVLGL